MMGNVLWTPEFAPSLAVLLHEFPEFQQLLDITIKSVLLLAAFVLLDAMLAKRLSHASRHLLWLSGLLCLALLPFIPAALFWVQSATASTLAPSVLFELPVYASTLPAGEGIHWGGLLLVVYLAPVALLLSRLVLALCSLVRVYHCCYEVSGDAVRQLETLRQQLSISRRVTLHISAHIESPVSFGLIRPRIMLPAYAEQWSESVLIDVLLHELCHIKRLDWLTTLFAYVLACLFWINPLVWLAVRHLREESENSCDAAVLRAGRSEIDYAESLLGVASSCIRARRDNNSRSHRSNPMMQSMFDQNTLKTRISRVLEESKMKTSEARKELKKTVAFLFVLSGCALAVLGSTQVLHAQQQPGSTLPTLEPRSSPEPRSNNDVEMLPINLVEPRYPTVAAEAGIEGWVHMRFTVLADGSILDSSVNVVDAEPSDIFNASAVAAAKQFRFSPRIVAGQAVDVPNVQYVFRYLLSEDAQPDVRPETQP